MSLYRQGQERREGELLAEEKRKNERLEAERQELERIVSGQLASTSDREPTFIDQNTQVINN